MKSSQVITAFALAIVMGVIAFLVANTLGKEAPTIAVSAALGALVANIISSLLNKQSASQSADEQVNNNSASGINGDIKTLYVGNLPYRANEAAVRTLFSAHGAVHSVRLMKDKHTGKRRGFGFVEMAAADTAGAISALNDSEFQQRTLKVREAKERPERTESSVQ
ncbi:RNA recognition motif domain-containing protein [Thalassotalea euphylliae]|uniref:RNA-binding protein n=1 Tax=Thalassotalea euphylliae TaxID=1655234 RepID=A0A3E0U249_9GAMM|nr:RNA-binding protein [Thalassotalea euphylliae]REL30998.1 RNA-binding protein [Thalassotalea euphylliae]